MKSKTSLKIFLFAYVSSFIKIIELIRNICMSVEIKKKYLDNNNEINNSPT